MSLNSQLKMISFEVNNIPTVWDHSCVASDQLVCTIANDLADVIRTFPLSMQLTYVGLCVFWRTFINTLSPSMDDLACTFLLKLLAMISCCAAMRINIASRNSSIVFRSLISRYFVALSSSRTWQLGYLTPLVGLFGSHRVVRRASVRSQCVTLYDLPIRQLVTLMRINLSLQ